MVAFATSLLIALAGSAAVIAYGKRREPGRYLTWGEAMAAAVVAFILMMLWYGVIPHQWITLADTEWKWRADRLVSGPWGIVEKLPMNITYVVLRDLVTLTLYGAALGLHVFHWMHWQNRSKAKAVVVPASQYGRPLARKS